MKITIIKGRILIGIPKTSRKHVPIFPHDTVQEDIMKNRPLSFVTSGTENSKGNKPNSFKKSHVKDKDVLPSYQDISSRVSTEIDTNFQSEKNHNKIFWNIYDWHKEECLGRKETKVILKRKTTEHRTKFCISENS